MSNGRRNAYMVRIRDPKLRAVCVLARGGRQEGEGNGGKG